MPLKETYPKEDFWLKIHMKDHVWDDFSDHPLDSLDEFEKQLNENIYQKFLVWLRTGKAKVKISTGVYVGD